MALITDLPAASSLTTTDLLIKDTGSATQKIAISDAYATASQPGLVSTGTQTIAGAKTFSGTLTAGENLYITRATGVSPFVYFTSGGSNTHAIFGMTDTTNNVNRPDRFQFREYSYNSSTGATLNYYERYLLPSVTAGKTSNSDYDIITTKTTPTHTQIATNFTLTAWWNVVTIDFNGYTPSASTYTTLAAAYRPNYTAHGICRWNNGTNYYPALITILSTGAVSGSYFNPNTGTATSISSGTLVGSITFVAK